jgi:hypothetical protein
MDDQKYLVRFAQSYLFVRKTAGSPVAQGSLFLSAGTQFSFLAAAEVTRRLRILGYTDAVVATLRGAPVTADNANQAESYNEIETASVWAELEPASECPRAETPQVSGTILAQMTPTVAIKE